MAAKGLEAVNWLTEDINVELDRERIVFQGKQNSLLHELERALADKTEVEKPTDEDVERLQREIKVFKLIKY